MNLHPIRTRRKAELETYYNRGYLEGVRNGHHEGWQAGWNAAQATHTTSDELTAADEAWSGTQVIPAIDGATAHPACVTISGGNIQPAPDPYEAGKKQGGQGGGIPPNPLATGRGGMSNLVAAIAGPNGPNGRIEGATDTSHCLGTTRHGNRCQLPVTPGTNTCHHHRKAV